jgi:hypothetical protein
MSAKTYDLRQSSFFYGLLSQEAGEGGWVKITPRGPLVEVVTDVIGGQSVHCSMPGNASDYTIELTLLQGSAFNVVLSAIKKAGLVKLPLVIDSQTEKFVGQGTIMQEPEMSISSKVGDRVWTFAATGIVQAVAL